MALVAQIGGYVLFPVAPGESAVGVIVGASENETAEPNEEVGMTLLLVRPRRILNLNLLGQLREQAPFSPGVSTYPTLDTPALLPTEEELRAILEYRPAEKDEDVSLPVGSSPVYPQQPVTTSFNDLLARPLGIVGNTGSGKSWSVASIMQSSIKALNDRIAPKTHQELTSKPLPKFIILDINGEYASAFHLASQASLNRALNEVYINGMPFQLPLWTFNLAELVRFFDASEASQQPTLERVVTAIREDTLDKEERQRQLRQVIRVIDECQSHLDNLRACIAAPTGTGAGRNARRLYEHLIARIQELSKRISDYGDPYLEALSDFGDADTYWSDLSDRVELHYIPPEDVEQIRKRITDLAPKLDNLRDGVITTGFIREITADTPIPFEPAMLLRDDYFLFAISRMRGQERIHEYIATLRLRIHRQLSDRRWSVFTSGTGNFPEIIRAMIGENTQPVVVVDCSMLAHDVLPFFCAVFGRILLELRAHADPAERTTQPYVLVLEEAHNYLKPPRQGEPAGLALARETFERIAKEGRKFGLSLIIASQRPSDVSATVLSQCANFLVHRIQNPEDIEYFKKILPAASKGMLDQLPILAPGEGLLIGSAVNVPARVRIHCPEPPPSSETPKPWRAWQPGEKCFDVEQAIEFWTRSHQDEEHGSHAENGE